MNNRLLICRKKSLQLTLDSFDSRKKTKEVLLLPMGHYRISIKCRLNTPSGFHEDKEKMTATLCSQIKPKNHKDL